MALNSDIHKGDRVAYIPDHAKGDIKHPDVEYGSVTFTDEYIVVRFGGIQRVCKPENLKVIFQE